MAFQDFDGDSPVGLVAVSQQEHEFRRRLYRDASRLDVFLLCAGEHDAHQTRDVIPFVTIDLRHADSVFVDRISYRDKSVE